MGGRTPILSSKVQKKNPIHLFSDFRNFLETWASKKEDGFLKSFLIEGSKMVSQSQSGDIPLETIQIYIETLQTIVSKQ